MADQRPPQIGPEEILREGGASQPVKPHSFVELTGAKLALAVGGLGAAVTLVLVAYWVWTAPVISLDLKEGDPEKLRQMLDLQKTGGRGPSRRRGQDLRQRRSEMPPAATDDHTRLHIRLKYFSQIIERLICPLGMLVGTTADHKIVGATGFLAASRRYKIEKPT